MASNSKLLVPTAGTKFCVFQVCQLRNRVNLIEAKMASQHHCHCHNNPIANAFTFRKSSLKLPKIIMQLIWTVFSLLFEIIFLHYSIFLGFF